MIELLLEAERALSLGQVDRAEQLYRQVADADPHNSIAVVGLGRVALERGDDLGAYLLARRALAIDPENEAAGRLATRMERVLATRGDPVADPMPPAPPVAAASEAEPVPSTPPVRADEAPGTAPDAPPGDAATPGLADPSTTPPATRRRSPLDRFLRRH